MHSFSIWNQSVVPCPILTIASWPAYRFLKRQVRWSGIPISFRIFHSLLWSTQLKGFGIVNKAEIDVFLVLSCFFHDPLDVGNLISGSSAFSKTSLNIWRFMVHVLLKPGLENFKHYFIIEIILWFISFNLLTWCFTLIDLHILKNLCIPGINPTWSWCVSFLMCCWILFG